MRKKWVKQGSYTMEATFIIPFLLFVIFTLCYLTFYLHDKLVMETEANRSLRKAELRVRYETDREGFILYAGLSKRELYSFISTQYQDIEEWLERDLLKALENRLMNLEVGDYAVEMKAESVRVNVSGMGKTSIPIVKRLLGNSKIRIQVDKGVHNPCEFVRRWETVSEIVHVDR